MVGEWVQQSRIGRCALTHVVFHFSGEEHGEWRRVRAEVLTSSFLHRAALLTAREVSHSPLVVDQTCAVEW